MTRGVLAAIEARQKPFHVLKEKARKTKLEAEQHRDLAARQRAARRARSHSDDLGMVHIHLELEPHAGIPLVARAEAEAQRLARKAKGTDSDGVACVDCGKRFRTEFDHVQPRAAGGSTSAGNLKPRCWHCHQAKTERDRRAGHDPPPPDRGGLRSSWPRPLRPAPRRARSPRGRLPRTKGR